MSHFLLGRNPHLLHYATRQGKKHEKHLFHRRESNPTNTIMENQCYSREPHWELSKKEVKLDPLRGIEPRKNHYGIPIDNIRYGRNRPITGKPP